MEKKQDFTGDYDILAPQVVDLAYAMNDFNNLSDARAKAKTEVDKNQRSSEAFLSQSLGSLVEDDAVSRLSGDELLLRYGEIIREYSDAERVDNFKEMMRIGARLVPEEVFISDGEVKTIAEPNTEVQEEGEEPTAKPEILVLRTYYYNDPRYKLVWSVPVVGETDRIRIDASDVVGRDSIKSYLDDIKLGDIGILRVIKVAQNYEAIGEKEAAERCYATCVKNAAYNIEHGYLSSFEMFDNLQALRNAGALNGYLPGLARRIALDSTRDNPDKNLFATVRALVILDKAGEGTHESSWDIEVANKEVFSRWIELEERGKALINEENSQSA